MTTTVYIDILFAENFLIDFFVLYITSFINNRKFKVIRCIAGSMTGALYACMFYITDIGIISNFFIKFLVINLIIFIAFKIKRASEYLRLILTYISVNFILAGGIYFAGSFLGNGEKASEVLFILIGVVLISVMGKGFFMLISEGIMKREYTKETLLFYNNKIIRLKTFEDTGNMLVEPISKCPVVIVSKNRLKEIADINSIAKIKNARLIPYKSVSDKFELLYGFKPDKFIYNAKEMNVVVAISKEDFGDENYDAIINPATLI